MHKYIVLPTSAGACVLQAMIHANLAPVQQLTLHSTADTLLDTITHATALTSLTYSFSGLLWS